MKQGWLEEQLAKRPMFTNSLVSGLISIIADLLRQWLTQKEGLPPDAVSIVRQFVLGSGVVAPLATAWYALVERLFRGWDAGRLLTVMAKTSAEQALFAPVINASFMISLGLLEGRNVGEVRQELEAKFVEVMRGNVAFWAPAGLVSYKFVPPRFRVLFGKLLSVFWMVFLISKTAKAAEGQPALRGTATAVEQATTAGAASPAPAAGAASPAPAAGEPPRPPPEAGPSTAPVQQAAPVEAPAEVQAPPGAAAPPEVPDHRGDWVVARVAGDWDEFLKEVGFGWLKRKALQKLGYGVNSIRMQVGQEGDDFDITNIALKSTSMKFRVGRGEQPATSMEGDPIVLDPFWTGDGGQVLECKNKSSDGKELPSRRQYMEGDELVVELVSLKGVSAARFYRRA